MINEKDFDKTIFSVAFTESIDTKLRNHLNQNLGEEDLIFALWIPSYGLKRFTAIINEIIPPEQGDRNIHGNASFNTQYVRRVLNLASDRFGVAFLHSHLGPGWQYMSKDDENAEGIVLASPVAGRTNLPLLGLTSGTDGSWSARFWLKKGIRDYKRVWVNNVRVVGKQLRITNNPDIARIAKSTESQIATKSVWGEENQSLIANIHVGIIGLGSVGSIVAECLSRIGVSHITLIDPENIEIRNLDRTLGATMDDAKKKTPKVKISERLIKASHTSTQFHVNPLVESLLSEEGIKMSLDCDVVFSCVDRPWPRHTLNALAYSNLIPVVDGGIIAKTKDNLPLHINWRIHVVGPERKCLVCLGALKREEIGLDREGLLDDPKYIQNLDSKFKHLTSRENVFPFSASLAAHEVIQFIGLITGLSRVGGIGPQIYHAYPGKMEVTELGECNVGCEYDKLTASAKDMRFNIIKHNKTRSI